MNALMCIKAQSGAIYNASAIIPVCKYTDAIEERAHIKVICCGGTFVVGRYDLNKQLTEVMRQITIQINTVGYSMTRQYHSKEYDESYVYPYIFEMPPEDFEVESAK
jgi:hypothetical protein